MLSYDFMEKIREMIDAEDINNDDFDFCIDDFCNNCSDDYSNKCRKVVSDCLPILTYRPLTVNEVNDRSYDEISDTKDALRYLADKEITNYREAIRKGGAKNLEETAGFYLFHECSQCLDDFEKFYKKNMRIKRRNVNNGKDKDDN